MVITVEIDRCPSCGGIVLDKGESEVVEALGVARILEVAKPSAAGAVRSAVATCHECSRPMIALTGAGDVEYDWCDGCERIFFDRGELSALDAFKSD